MGLASTAAIIIGREIGAGHKDRVYGVGLALNTLAARRRRGAGIGPVAGTGFPGAYLCVPAV